MKELGGFWGQTCHFVSDLVVNVSALFAEAILWY